MSLLALPHPTRGWSLPTYAALWVACLALPNHVAAQDDDAITNRKANVASVQKATAVANQRAPGAMAQITKPIGNDSATATPTPAAPPTRTPTARLANTLQKALVRDTGDLKYLREVMQFRPADLDPMASILDLEDTLVPRLEDVSIEALVVAADPKKRFVLLSLPNTPIPRTVREGDRVGNFTVTRIERTGLVVLVRRNGRLLTVPVPYGASR